MRQRLIFGYQRLRRQWEAKLEARLLLWERNLKDENSHPFVRAVDALDRLDDRFERFQKRCLSYLLNVVYRHWLREVIPGFFRRHLS